MIGASFIFEDAKKNDIQGKEEEKGKKDKGEKEWRELIFFWNGRIKES